MELAVNSEYSDMQNVWLLATLGSKAPGRKNFNKAILQTRIPDVCLQLIGYSSRASIRINSCMMFGISVAYRKQVERMLEEVSLMKNRLAVGLQGSTQIEMLPVFQMVANVANELLPLESERKSTSHILEDDPAFSINRDFISHFDGFRDDDPLTKKRRIAIEEHDKVIFPGLTRMTPVSSLSGTGVTSRQSTFLVPLPLENMEDIDLEVNDDGFLILKNYSLDKSASDTSNNQILNDLDMDAAFTGKILQPLEDEKSHSLTNDLDFALAANIQNTDPNRGEVASKSDDRVLIVEKYSKLKFANLQIDNDLLKIPSVELIESHQRYERQMKEAHYRKACLTRSKNWLETINQKLNRAPFRFAGDSSTSMLNSILRDLDRSSKSLFDAEAEIEYSKRAIGNEYVLDELPFVDIFDAGLEQSRRATLGPPSSDMFDLDIGILQHNYSSQTHSQSMDHELGFGLSFVDDVDVTPPSNTCLGHTTVLFLQFISERARQLGHLHHDCEYPLKELNEVQETIENYDGGTFATIEFNRLIPASDVNTGLEKPVSRSAAANAFASLLTLASKELVYVTCKPRVDWRNSDLFTITVPV